jgi:hypothetical protein
MRPDTGCSDALWSLGRVPPTPARLPQALPASPCQLDTFFVLGGLEL